jgi:hypothetical protein
MNPSDYDVFHKLKGPLKGQRFQHSRALMTETQKRIKELNDNNELLGTLELNKRWEDIIDRHGNYKVPVYKDQN